MALSDYSALFSNNSDMMFDAVKFGVAIVTDEAFDNLEETHLKYRYSWTYDDPPQGEKAEKERSDDFLEILADYKSVTGYIPRYANQAIHFTGDDMGSDRSMMIVLLYILIAIMAFVFAVTTNNTIVKEAAVIGTLRASGYTRKELLMTTEQHKATQNRTFSLIRHSLSFGSSYTKPARLSSFGV